MSKPVWTDEQEAAITRKDCNLLVSAAAGAGKTAVLVERIIRRLLDAEHPVDVDQLLVVTFTNAAAREMKERVDAALTRRCRENPADKRLQKQLLLLGKAHISTLHSFCLELIRRNYYLLQLPEGFSLDPHFRIADDIESALLKLEALEDLLEDRYSAEEPAFLTLAEGFGGERDDKVLQDLVLKLYDYSRSQPQPDRWLAEIAQTFYANLEDQAVQRLFTDLQDSLHLPLEEALDQLKEAYKLALSPAGPVIYCRNLEEEISGLEEILQARKLPWQAQLQIVGDFHFRSLKPCKGQLDEELKLQVQSLRNDAKKIIQRLQKEFISRSPQELTAEMKKIAPCMEALCQLTVEFAGCYQKLKLKRALLDFTDIEHLALSLLQNEEEGSWKPSALAKELQGRFAEVLIDEYQDINGVQENILSRVSRQDSVSPNLFMVGDVKQSIYGFRLADPSLFLRKYLHYGRSPGKREEKIILTKNFRSQKTVIDGVNYLFRQIMSAGLGGISYDRDAELVFGANVPTEEIMDHGIEVHLIECQSAGEDGESLESSAEGSGAFEEAGPGEDQEDPAALQLEARLIGRRIQELIRDNAPADNVPMGKGPERKALHYRDMVVLLRSTREAAAIFLEEFRDLGIPAYAETGTGYFEAQEVQIMLSLLKIIDNPRQDIPLAAVLHSPVVGLSADELTQIRLLRIQGDYFDALRLASRKAEGGTRAQARKFLKQLQRWRTFARRNSLVDLIWLLYRETGYYDFAGAMPGGKQRQANLQALYDRAKQYENTTLKGLFKFLRFLEKLEDTSADLGTARALGEKEDVVRIMSIHKSKGLEFPVVFLAGLGKQFNLRDLYADILIDKDLGLGPVWVDVEQRLKYPTLAKMAVRNKRKREMLAEEIRILYVALTRAKNSLILVGSLKNIEKKLKKWTKVLDHETWELPVSMIHQAACFWDWIGISLLRHPGGQALRSLMGCRLAKPFLFTEDPSCWQIQIWKKEDFSKTALPRLGEGQKQVEQILKFLPVDEDLEQFKGIEKQLGWKYSRRQLSNIPAKLSVTELKNRFLSLTQDPLSEQVYIPARQFGRRPRFLQEDAGLSSSEKGLALHLVMQHLSLQGPLDEENIEKQMAGLVDREILSPLQKEAIIPLEIAGFFRSPLGARMIRSTNVRREVSFTLALPACEIYPELSVAETERIILQGTIDCLFAEGNEWVLVDYKTDRVAIDAVGLFKERYKIQMKLYSRAVESIMRQHVKERVLYSFALGQAVVVE